MNLNLLEPFNSDFVEGSVLFEPAKDPFDGNTPMICEFPSGGLKRQMLSIVLICLNNRLGTILLFYELTQFNARVTSIGQHTSGVKLAISEPSLPERAGGPMGVVDIGCCYIECQGEFIIDINHEMGTIAKPILLEISDGAFDRPSCVGICGWSLGFVSPSPNISGIYSNIPAKAWKGSVTTPDHLPANILNQMSIFSACKFGHETRERRLTGKLGWGIDTAGLGNIRVVLEDTNQGRNGGQAQYVPNEVATPEYPSLIPWSTKSPVFVKGFEKFFIGQSLEDCRKFGNDRGLCIRKGYSIITVGHREANPSCWLGDVGVNGTCVSVFVYITIFGTIVLDSCLNVKGFRHEFGSIYENNGELSLNNAPTLGNGREMQCSAYLISNLALLLTWYILYMRLVEARGIEPRTARMTTPPCTPVAPMNLVLSGVLACVMWVTHRFYLFHLLTKKGSTHTHYRARMGTTYPDDCKLFEVPETATRDVIKLTDYCQ